MHAGFRRRPHPGHGAPARRARGCAELLPEQVPACPWHDDSHQDTSNLQYRLAAALAGKWENICVVGDDDQSIYRFRGATIENILSFEKQYRGARVIRLEQNYRSTKNILEASNAVIKHNLGRKVARSCGPAMTPGTRSRSTPP
ncbi:MAG: UvrD-helicase domain-containing protein [Intestinimonas sp.]